MVSPNRRKAFGIRHDMVLTDVAAEGVDAGNTRSRPQDGTQHPILKTTKLHEIPLRTFQRILENLAQAGRNRAEIRAHTFGQFVLDGEQTFHDELAREINIGSVFKDDRDHGKAELGKRAHVGRVRQSRTGLLDRVSHQLFHFERRERRRLGNDGDLDIGHVGKGVDGKSQQGSNTRADEKNGEENDDEAVGQREIDQTLHDAP